MQASPLRRSRRRHADKQLAPAILQAHDSLDLKGMPASQLHRAVASAWAAQGRSIANLPDSPFGTPEWSVPGKASVGEP